MYNPDDYEMVLVVRMRNGEIDSIVNESRKVHESSKGRYIQTVDDGRWYLVPNTNVAIISKRLRPYTAYDGSIQHRWESEKNESLSIVSFAVESLLKEYDIW